VEPSSYTLEDLRNWRTRTNDGRPVRLGIFGDPVEHSFSPQMQNAALEACELDMQYGRFHIKADELAEALRLLPALDFIGINLTLPHKVNAAAFVDELDPFARSVGAINAVRIDGDKLIGFNTDGPGFARAIRQEFSVDLRDLRVLLLGAGSGAGRSIAHQCAAENCERLVLVNRTAAKAEQLAAELKDSFADTRVAGPVARLQAIPWNDHALRQQIANTDLVVNATTLGMKRSDPPVLTATLLEPHLMVYDTVYTPPRTSLLAAATEAGALGANGLSMLLHQGALAFERWFDRDAPLDVMRAALTASPI
jgi:shikimate dehydrogenase